MNRRLSYSIVFAGFLWSLPNSGTATCLDPLGDINLSGDTDVIDIVCEVSVILDKATGTTPECLQASEDAADLSCDGVTNVIDALLLVSYVTNSSDSVCPEACQVGQTSSVTICVNPSGSGFPSSDYSALVANGSWNDWAGWGMALADDDLDGLYCGTLSDLQPGDYEYVHAATGSADSWSGWGPVGNAPLGSLCDVNPNDEWANFGFTIVAGQDTEICHSWSGCDCGETTSPAETDMCSNNPGRSVPITTNQRQIQVGDNPIHIKGVAWSPIPIGSGPGNYFADTVEEDAALMAQAGINVVRTYGPILDTAVLDTLWEHNIFVMMTVFYGYSDSVESALSNVCAIKDHPAVMGWVVGNEWNYNNLGNNIPFSQAVQTVSDVVAAIQYNDATRPVSTVYGYLPDTGVLDALNHVDVWGLNVYSGSSFGNLFANWESLSDKPMYFAEYGYDAYNGTINQEDEQSQSSVVVSLTTEIYNHTSVDNSGVCAGGFVFEFNDEWWKYNDGSWWVHDTNSSWDNWAYPDPNMNEEWWGIVDIYRNPRQAYWDYAQLNPPTAQ